MLSIDDIPNVFHDIEPISQVEEEDSAAVCTISYPKSFIIAYDYMRGIWKCKEYSQRTLDLTTICLQLNPANYTVWHYRRQILKNLELDTSKESIEIDLMLASKLGGTNPKNYQIWYHRRNLLENICGSGGGVAKNNNGGDDNQQQHDDLFKYFVTKELDYIADVLKEDGKNYHAWSYRQWIIITMNDPELWKLELQYCKQKFWDPSCCLF